MAEFSMTPFRRCEMEYLSKDCKSIDSMSRESIKYGIFFIDYEIKIKKDSTTLTKAILYYKKGYCLNLLHQNDEAIEILVRAKKELSEKVKIWEKNDFYRWTKDSLFEKLHLRIENSKSLLNAIDSFLKQLEPGHSTLSYHNQLIKLYYNGNQSEGISLLHSLHYKSEFKSEFNDPDNLEHRKAIAIIKDNTMPVPTKMLFCLEKAAATNRLGLEFPTGHPVVNQVYYAHPIRPKYYIPASEYDEIIFKEKVDEFQRLVEGLGATEIKIFRADGLYLDNTNESKFGTEASVGYKSFGLSGSFNSQEQNTNSYSEKSLLLKDITLRPTGNPYVQEGIYWLNYEKEWQYIRDGRLKNTITHHSVMISNEAKKFISSQDATTIAAEAKLLSAHIGGKVNFENSYTSSSKQIQTKRFEVFFGSTIDTVSTNDKTSNSSINQGKQQKSSWLSWLLGKR